MPRFSAYLSIYEDWEFVEPSLKSIAPLLDELVVVDGAYRWMANYVRANGRDPERSNRKVYDALSRCGVPLKVINGTWNDEFEKRAAGYSACKNAYIFRVDSDEIVFANEKAVADFVASGGAVAEMEIPPVCRTPEWCEANPSFEWPPESWIYVQQELGWRQ